ncbi:outer membrane beta-barrel protein [Tenacibaculum agarivorans]|uniref:outer membrane beta-barrel protein n=1 Tax=Tenacibaculum agarivorans TaxID=1908389 RepID=UPI00094BB069|nr:outer membrane beta-barrel protein [Tenacibaculum agarivorans]
MSNINKLKLLLFTCLLSTVAFAQEEEKEKKGKLSFGGSVDAYYQSYFTASDNANPTFGTSFANQAGFGLGMINLIGSYEMGKTGAVADIAFGSRGVDAVGGGKDVFVNQLYVYWNVSEKTTLTFGRFNTYLGYEVISPTGNFNYSTSHLFSNGPFSHVGLKADFTLSDDFSLMLAVMNVTDVNTNLTGVYSVGAQLGFKDQYLNFYYDGGEKLGFEIDYTGGFDVTDEFFLGINAAYADNDGAGFYGAALYPQVALSDDFKLGLRGEFFSELGDNNFFAASEDDSVLGLTLTGSYSVENLTIKPEIRLDSNSEEVFPDNDGLPTSTLAAFTLGAIYSF